MTQKKLACRSLCDTRVCETDRGNKVSFYFIEVIDDGLGVAVPSK